MRKSTETKITAIRSWLDQTLEGATPGDRLPNVKAIMRQFATAQRTVQQALKPAIDGGRLRAQPGSGLIICDPDREAPAAAWEGDLLVLYRISESRLARSVLQEMEARLKSRGSKILQIGYSSEAQALDVLRRMGRFKACLIQIHFEVISIDFLAALRQCARHIIVDGVSAVGIDADAIGTNWREALSVAFRTLQEQGHQRIGFLTSAHQARQISMARREFRLLCRWLPDPAEGYLIEIDKLPGAMHIDDVKGALAPLRRADGRLPFTALIAWGIVEGFVLERALTDLDADVGNTLSVMLLGSTDFPSEHINRFDVIGNSHAQKLDVFEQVISRRIALDRTSPQVHYLEIDHIRHGSVIPIGDDWV